MLSLSLCPQNITEIKKNENYKILYVYVILSKSRSFNKKAFQTNANRPLSDSQCFIVNNVWETRGANLVPEHGLSP